MAIITRFAPSPTGPLHIGTARTALFSWLCARSGGGKFLLRVEDTDRARSTQEFTDALLEALDWLGLSSDEPPVYQSQRMDLYRAEAEELVRAGKAYHCTCTRERLDELRAQQMKKGLKPKYDGKCRDLGITPSEGVASVVRFKNPLDGEVVVDDLVQGRVSYQNAQLDDLIIIRSDGTPTYNFAVVVDECDMRVTHVLRGDDHLNNTPRQINMFRALGAEPPQFGHLPMILAPDGKKMSKRDNPPSVLEYRDGGYLPEAVLNYLARLGWSSGDQEIFTVDELIDLFDVSQVNRSPASLDPKKLEWINHQHVMSADTAAVAERVREIFSARGIDLSAGPDLASLIETQKPRSKTLVELVERSEFFYREFDDYEPKAASKFLTAESAKTLRALHGELAQLDEWTKEAIHDVLARIVERSGLKFVQVAQPARVALTGDTISPGIDDTLVLIGRERALDRLKRAMRRAEQGNR